MCSEHTDHARTRTADARLDTHSTSSASARRTKTCALAAMVTAVQWSSGACAPRQVQRVSVCRATMRCKLFVGLTPRESTHNSGTSTEACECPCVGRTQPSHWFNPTVKVCDDPMSIRDLETVALTRAKVTLFSSALGSGSACTCHHVSEAARRRGEEGQCGSSNDPCVCGWKPYVSNRRHHVSSPYRRAALGPPTPLPLPRNATHTCGVAM